MMSKNLITVTLNDNIYEIAVKMKEHDIGFIPVVDGKQLLGVVTDRDLVLRGYAEKRSGSGAVEEVMSNELVTVSPHTTVDEAAQLMAEHKIRRLPVIENNELVGIIAIGDLAVRSIHENEASEALSKISENTDKHYADGNVDYAGVH